MRLVQFTIGRLQFADGAPDDDEAITLMNDSPYGLTASIWTRDVDAAAQIVAPAAGRVIYAGRFRGYGNIVILDHGDGWSSLVAGLGNMHVRVGDAPVQGTPLGSAPKGEAPRITIELRRKGQPVDLAQLLD